MLRSLKLVTLVALLMMCNACAWAQWKIHVAPLPLTYPSPAGDMGIQAGQGFVLAIPYQGGTPPFTCALSTAGAATDPTTVPSYVSLQTPPTDGYCTVTADSTPTVPPSADITFNLTISDSKSQTSTIPIIITATPEPTPAPAAMNQAPGKLQFKKEAKLTRGNQVWCLEYDKQGKPTGYVHDCK